MWHWSTTCLCLAAIIWVGLKISNWIAFQRAQLRNGCESPPKYPHKDPVLGLDYWRNQKQAAQSGQWLPTSKALFAKYGKTYEVNNLGERLIHTMDKHNIQSVWALNFHQWGLQPLREGIAEPFFGHGINTTDGEFWRYSRALVRPTFARTSAANLKFLNKHADRLLEQLPTDGGSVDLQPLLSCLILDASTEFLFGESMNSLLPGQSAECAQFIKSFDYCLYGIGARVRLGQLRFLHYDKKWHEAIKVVHAQVDKYIDKAMQSQATHKATGTSTGKSNKESGRYVLVDEMAKQTQDKADLRSQILSVFMPGRDSTAHALANIFHVLAGRPDVYGKLREDVLRFGDVELTFETLKSMKYLQWVLSEGFRTHPTTAQSYRKALEDTLLPTGGGKDGLSPIYIRKGDTVMASMWGLHQDVDIWGDDAAEFRPERFKDLKAIWTFVPFLGGPRTCPAQQLVITQMSFVLARFARAYSQIINVDPHPWHVDKDDMKTELRRIGFQSRYGVLVKFVPASSKAPTGLSTTTLESYIFNQDLYRRVVGFWLPSWPNVSSSFTKADALRWFAATPMVDSQCEAIAATAVAALGPSAMPLPPFTSLETDSELYTAIAAPLISVLEGEQDFQREHTALALVLLVDQMPRNMFRGKAQAVVYTHYDRLARAFATYVRTTGLDRASCFAASPVWRYWLELPLQHSESVEDHSMLNTRLQGMLTVAQNAPDEMGIKFVERALSLEKRHLVPLKKFGRFPWRNQWLERESTEAEELWLRDGGDRFGTG